MRVLVCGGREYSDSRALARVLDEQHDAAEITLLIQGGQRQWDARREKWIGADWLASEWARWREVPFVNEPARWLKHGKAAGPIRNQQMLNEGKPDLVIAFPGGRGTADMVRQAKAAGVRVTEIEVVPTPPRVDRRANHPEASDE